MALLRDDGTIMHVGGLGGALGVVLAHDVLYLALAFDKNEEAEYPVGFMATPLDNSIYIAPFQALTLHTNIHLHYLLSSRRTP